MERFKYDKYAPSIRIIRSRRALSIVDKPGAPVRPVVANDIRARGNRIVSSRNDLRINKSKSFLDHCEFKENLYPHDKVIEKKLLNSSLCGLVETSELTYAPKVLTAGSNKFLMDLEKMEEKLSSFYAGL